VNSLIPYEYGNEQKEQPHRFSLYDTACVIMEDIDPVLIDYFNQKIIKDKDLFILLQNHLMNWVKENNSSSLLDAHPDSQNITEPTMLNLIYCELSSLLSQDDEPAALKKIKEAYRNRKKYLFAQIREEMGELPIKPQNARFIANEWELLNDPIIRCSVKDTPDTYEEFSKIRFGMIKDWFQNKDSYLIHFYYMEKLSLSRKLSCFVVDLNYNCLSIICSEYYRSKSGFVTGTLDTHLGLKDVSLFSWQSNALELRYEVADGVMQVYESLELSPNNALKIIVHEQPFDEQTEPEELFLEIKEDIEKGKQYRALDTFDVSILTAILNNFSVASLQDKSVRISLVDLAKDVYGDSDIRIGKYERLVKHIIRLGRTRISNVSTTDNGLLLGGGNITFFEYKFQIMANSVIKDENVLTTINMASGDSKIDFSKLSTKDYTTMELVFFLSNYMYSLWNNSMHTYISSTLYRQIESSKGRVLMQILQEERLKIYPVLKTFIPLATFKAHLNLSSKLTRFRKELAEELEVLKNSNITVAEYEVINAGVNITFNELSTAEKRVYKL